MKKQAVMVDSRKNMKTNLCGVRCLVLGGSGFIGANLCRGLIDSGAVVRSLALDLPVANGATRDIRDRVEWVCGSLADSALIRTSLRDIDVVFHLVSTTLPATSNNDIPFDLTSNVLPTLQMLEVAKDCDVQRVIFVSSGGAIYGVPERVPISESHATNPICAYGIHKLAIEKYLQMFHHLWRLDYRIIRPSNPYGAGQPVNRAQGAVANFVQRVMGGEPIEIWGDGSVVRDYIYITDLIESCISLVNHQGSSRVFNIGTGRGHTLLELVSMLETVVGSPVKVHFREARSLDVPVNVLDVTRATSELNWYPSTGLEDGIRRMVEYARSTAGLNSTVAAT